MSSSLMDQRPERGTLHRLRNRHTGREATFEWTGKTWSTPGTGWGTKPAMMATLGWSYVGPVDATPNEEDRDDQSAI